jgi:SAM-dependent methyltransferase
MSAEIDYVLGTHDEEIERLGVQHRVWQPLMLDAWIRAGIGLGSHFADFGAGPGFATIDAAAMVGPGGEVTAIERSRHFLNFAKNQVSRQRFSWVRFVQADLDADELALQGIDLAWCRWVASFVTSPKTLIERISGCLRIGGKAVMHEYQNYSTWQSIPRGERLAQFVQEIMASWRAAGGEPNIANELPPLMDSAGLKVISVRPLISTINPKHFTWSWPAAFIAGGSRRLVELGRVSPAFADELQAELHRLELNPDAVMITPLVLEIIAEKIA